jgi:hypothetical protein
VNGQPGTRSWFEGYLDAFNRADFETLGGYYAPDVEFTGRAAELRGRVAVIEFYRNVRRRTDEHIELVSFMGSPELFAAEIITTLTPIEDWPDFPTGPLVCGIGRRSVNFVFYDLSAGKFTRIRSAGFRRLA